MRSNGTTIKGKFSKVKKAKIPKTIPLPKAPSIIRFVEERDFSSDEERSISYYLTWDNSKGVSGYELQSKNLLVQSDALHKDFYTREISPDNNRVYMGYESAYSNRYYELRPEKLSEPYIGDIKFRNATPKKLQGWVNDLSKFLSPKSIRNAVGLLSASFAYCVKLDMIASNPCANIILPKKERKEAEYYNEDEVVQFLSALDELEGEDLTYKVLFELALFCGFRKSELLGIEMQDVDLTECTIKIRQTRYSGGGGESRYETPKTLKSLRTVSFPAELKLDIIKLMSFYSDRAIALGDEWHPSTALFRWPLGKPVCPSQPLKRLNRLQEKHGLKKITLHQLRHTNVSIMISMGLDIKTIQERGGYSNSSTPLNIYGHLFRNQDARIAQDLYNAATKRERATNVRQK